MTQAPSYFAACIQQGILPQKPNACAVRQFSIKIILNPTVLHQKNFGFSPITTLFKHRLQV